jgi:hypothetical protein
MSKVFYAACKVCADQVSPELRVAQFAAELDLVKHMLRNHGEVLGFEVADVPGAEYTL